MNKVRTFLSSRRAPWVFAVLALLIGLLSIGNGFRDDDYFLRAAILAPPELPEMARSPVDLFTWTADGGRLSFTPLPWWASPDLQLAFFRPLASLTHAADIALWPDDPVPMHVHSLLYFVAAVFAAACLYRRLAGAAGAGAAWTAGLAGLVFALDDTHAWVLSWIASRNTVLQALFTVLTLLAYDRWRRDGWRPGAWCAPLCFGLALLSGEGGVGAGAWLLAYALCVDSGDLGHRLRGLVPAAAVGAGWVAAYKLLGYGVRATTGYVDPLRDPLGFAAAVAERAPQLLTSQLLFTPPSAPLVRLGVAFVLSLIVLLVVPLLLRDKGARFWALGMVLSILPLCGTEPQERLLFIPGLGGAALVAALVAAAFTGSPKTAPHDAADPSSDDDGEISRLWLWPARLAAAFLLFVHLVVSPLFFVGNILLDRMSGAAAGQRTAAFPDDPAIRSQTAVIVHEPNCNSSGFIRTYKALAGRPVPAAVLVLSTGLFTAEIERTGERTLVVRPEGGFLLRPGTTPPGRPPLPAQASVNQAMDWFYRGADEPFPDRIVHGDMTVTILERTPDGRPAVAAFELARPLDDPSWRWLTWQPPYYVPFDVPAVGERVRVPRAPRPPES